MGMRFVSRRNFRSRQMSKPLAPGQHHVEHDGVGSLVEHARDGVGAVGRRGVQ
jgi:hypothetical protein